MFDLESAKELAPYVLTNGANFAIGYVFGALAGRTGRAFPFKNNGDVPRIVQTANSIGNGLLYTSTILAICTLVRHDKFIEYLTYSSPGHLIGYSLGNYLHSPKPPKRPKQTKSIAKRISGIKLPISTPVKTRNYTMPNEAELFA